MEAFVEALGLLRDGGVASARPLRVNLGILKKQMYTHAADVISQIYICIFSLLSNSSRITLICVNIHQSVKYCSKFFTTAKL